MADIRKGDRVRVTKGRKLPVGTRLTVFWTGEGKFGPRIGVATSRDERLTYIDPANVEVVDEDEDTADEAEAAEAGEQLPLLKAAVNGTATAEVQPPAAMLLALAKLEAERDGLLIKVADLSKRLDAASAASRAAREETEAAQGALGAAKAKILAAGFSSLDEALAAAAQGGKPATATQAVDEAFLKKVAAFAAQGIEKAVLVALRDKLLPRLTPEQEAERAARMAGLVEPPVRVLDLDDAPAPAVPPVQTCNFKTGLGAPGHVHGGAGCRRPACLAANAPADEAPIAKAEAALAKPVEPAKPVEAAPKADMSGPSRARPVTGVSGGEQERAGAASEVSPKSRSAAVEAISQPVLTLHDAVNEVLQAQRVWNSHVNQCSVCTTGVIKRPCATALVLMAEMAHWNRVIDRLNPLREPLPEPIARWKAKAGGLAKCERCKRYKIGKHTC